MMAAAAAFSCFLAAADVLCCVSAGVPVLDSMLECALQTNEQQM